jgi:hypothetical protein
VEHDLGAGHGLFQRRGVAEIAGRGFGFQAFDILQVAGWANKQAEIGSLLR